MEEINGKVAFVRVGASGIGLGMTRAFLKAGMQAVSYTHLTLPTICSV